MAWLDDILACTAEFESPERYFWWSGISAIGAVARTKVWLDRFGYILYPNLYVLLIGKSGLKKNMPISMAVKLVKMTDCTRVYSGRASIQGIIADLGKAYTKKSKEIIKDANCYMTSTEFDTMLVSDDHAYSILTALYDFTDDWKNLLKHSATDHLTNVCINLFGASNEENLRLALPVTTLAGGYVARTVFVVEDREKLHNSLMFAPKIIPNYNDLVKRLVQITLLNGKFSIHPKSIELYDDWYYGKDFSEMKHIDSTGTLRRIHDTILKVAMCISLSYKDDLVIMESDMKIALEKCLECVPGMRRIFTGHGKHSLAEATKKVLMMLLNNDKHTMSRRQMLSNLYGTADALDLDRIIDTLSQAGAIESYREDDMIYYQMPDAIVQTYQKLKEELN